MFDEWMIEIELPELDKKFPSGKSHITIHGLIPTHLRDACPEVKELLEEMVEDLKKRERKVHLFTTETASK